MTRKKASKGKPVRAQRSILFYRTGPFGKLTDLCVAEFFCLVNEPGDCLSALKEAVTAWVLGTEKGKELWELSQQDLNIGDLAEYLDDRELSLELEKRNFRFLRVVEPDDAVSFDTVLADGPE